MAFDLIHNIMSVTSLSSPAAELLFAFGASSTVGALGTIAAFASGFELRRMLFGEKEEIEKRIN
jgi:hypothetical protein